MTSCSDSMEARAIGSFGTGFSAAVLRARRAIGPDAEQRIERLRWEAEWEALTRIPWREWLRRQQPKRVRIVLAENGRNTRVWIDEHEIHGLLRDVLVEHHVGSHGSLTLVIPLALVEIL